MVVQCCVCRRVRKGGGWVAVRPPEMRTEQVSHSYCPHCAQQLMEELRKPAIPVPQASPQNAA